MINDRFKIKKFLGEGRSRVFLCSDRFFLNHQFAIKILPPDSLDSERLSFRKEFETLQKFNHPNIVKAYEYGKILSLTDDETALGIEKGSVFFVLEYCHGKKISEINFLKNPDYLLKAIEQISAFLYFLHLSNYIYFDLKCDNILAEITENGLNIKFIDFGLIENRNTIIERKPSGTAVYLAPEIIQNIPFDHKVDLYSFGVLLYRLVYGIYPVEGKDEITIYNKKLKGSYAFPDNEFPEVVNKILQKLLINNPSERYKNTLAILEELGSPKEKYFNNWFSSAYYTERRNEIETVEEYLLNPERRDVYIIKGEEGSGKSAIANRIKNKFQNTIFIEGLFVKKSSLFPLYIINKIIYSEGLFNDSDMLEAEEIDESYAENNVMEFEKSNSLIIKLMQKKKFNLIIDDYELLDEIVKEYVLKLFPLMQINGCKIVLLMDINSDSKNIGINNKTEFVISPFTAADIDSFLNNNFADFVPKEKLKEIIIRYSDHLPGNIIMFLRDISLFNIVKFQNSDILVDDKADLKRILSGTQKEIYSNRLLNVLPDGAKILSFVSAIDAKIELNFIEKFTGLENSNVKKIINELKNKNLLLYDEKYDSIYFTSKGLKQFVYKKIKDKKKFHSKIVDCLKHNNNISSIELSRQYELACDYENSYAVLVPEINKAKKILAFGFLKKILSRVISFPLNEAELYATKKEYVSILIKLGDFVLALKTIDDILRHKIGYDGELAISKGICLINTGKVEDGKILLLEEHQKINDSCNKTELILEIANAELNTNEFDNVWAICEETINDDFATEEQHGRAYNFMGIVEIYKNDNLDGAIKYFEMALKKFENAGLQHRIARLKINLGNIYNMKGEHLKAEEYWNSSLEINTSIGDIEQEALLLMNYGIFNYDICNHEKALEFYERAKTIFATTGNQNGEGLALINSAETNLLCCDYAKSLAELKRAKEIFTAIGNKEEEASSIYYELLNYYRIGNKEKFDECLQGFINIGVKHNLAGKHDIQLKFMRMLSNIKDERQADTIDKNFFGEILTRFYELESYWEFVFAASVFIRHLIKRNLYEEAFYLLKDERLEKSCRKNVISRSELIYLTGILIKKSGRHDEAYLNYLNEAYELIKDESITELTWQVLFELGESYLERGLKQEAYKFIKNSKLLILFISENLDDDILRISYLTEPERKIILEKIDLYSKFFTQL